MKWNFITDKHSRNINSLWCWSLDFLRAYNEHSAIRKWLIRKLLGKYCVREMNGIERTLTEDGSNTKYEYGLKKVKYNGLS
jgi:hypothetical protein